MYTCAHTHTCTHMHTYMHTHMYTCAHTDICTHMCTHTCTHVYTHSPLHSPHLLSGHQWLAVVGLCICSTSFLGGTHQTRGCGWDPEEGRVTWLSLCDDIITGWSVRRQKVLWLHEGPPQVLQRNSGVCACVCICVCVYMCACCVHVCACVCVSIHVCVYMCMSIDAGVCSTSACFLILSACGVLPGQHCNVHVLYQITVYMN